MAILLESAVRATLIAATFALVLRVLRLRSPAVRHALWTAMVVLMLLLPAFTTWGPEIPIRVLPPRLGPEPVIPTATAPGHVGDFSTIGVPQGSHVASQRRTWVELLVIAYVIGSLVFAVRLLAGTCRAHALAPRATPECGRPPSPSCAT